MPTYQQILETDLSVLTSAADSWKRTATDLKKLADSYEQGVKSLSVGGDWRGQSADASLQPLGVTRQEYAAAYREARAMESVLRDAHSTLVRLKAQVKSAVADAVDAGMKVSEGGVASFDYSKVDAATANSVRHQPDLREVEQSYTRNITSAVKAVNDYDEDVKRALLSASGADGTAPSGFNLRPVGDVEAVEALLLTQKVRSGKASSEELEQYRNLLRANAHDKRFSEAFLYGLGGKDTLQLADQMMLAARESGVSAGDKKLYESISASLASTLGTGTKDPSSDMYKAFLVELRNAGDKPMDKDGSARGYQTLVTLMSEGGGYGKQFLNDVGEGILDAEGNGLELWHDADGAGRADFAADPLAGLLTVMSKNPEAAEYFLDPKAPGNENDHLKHLLTERDWGGSSSAGLGAALQAAATGHPPGHDAGPPGTHTEGQARVMHHAVKMLDADMKGHELPEELNDLRTPMARALADYVADTHVIFEGQNLGGVRGEESVVRSDQGGYQIAVGQASLVRVTRGLADDPYAFSLLHTAERVYSASLLDQLPSFAGNVPGESAAWNAETKDIGHALGVLSGIGEDVIADRHDEKDDWAEKTTTYTVNGVNAFVGEIPIVGSAASSLVDTIGFDWQKKQEEDNEEDATDDRSENYGAEKDGLNKMLHNWGNRESIKDSDAYKTAQDGANVAFDQGLNNAAQHLRPPRG
ncbi:MULTISPECIES: DUF6571 family protein [Streptomyces]|uniref:DUF6571 domain-containing protein n=1 Tax=Streptomyces sudanensis TaxID=436397 RepID=A0ABY4TGZ3_9ACTN|nr:MULTISPECIES: DUF6571 family protein [Streptomyces]URN16285.1 hypothetical protein MW084_10350 [Streptomyces sudanensis]